MERPILLNTYYGTAQKQAKRLPTLELLFWIRCRCIPSKYNGITADVLNKYIHGLSGISEVIRKRMRSFVLYELLAI